MSEHDDRRFEELLDRFEKAVELLERKAAGIASTAKDASAPEYRPSPPETPPYALPPEPRRAAPAREKKKPRQRMSASKGLRYAGVGLVLLGTAFLFNYVESEPTSIMWLRVAVAFAIGLGLVLIGQRMRGGDPQFGRVLTGSGIGVWFITGFAAYQLFALVPAAVAFAFMAGVTVLSFTLSMRENAAPLSVVGVIGGLCTPFLLRTGERGPEGAVVFLVFVVGGAISIYARRAWRPLLWTTVMGGWAAMLASIIQYLPDDGEGTGARVVLEAGVTFMWLAFAIVPAWREVAAMRSPERWPQTRTPGDTFDLQVLITKSPVIALVLTAGVWDTSRQTAGWIALGGAVLYTSVVLIARHAETFRGFVAAHIQASVILWVLFASLALEGDTMMMALATEAAVLHIMSARTQRMSLALWGHGLFLLLGAMTLARILTSVDHTPMLNRLAIADLWTLLAALVATFFMSDRTVRLTYRYPVHVMFLLLIEREFRHVTNGQAIVSAIWGVYATGLVIAGLRRGMSAMRMTGLVTLFVVIGKLIFIDLSEVRAIWRVLLFLGFGGGLLWLSYYFHRMSEPPRRADSEPPQRETS